ncbi:MAG: tetratricopeptide repeat protein [Phycisphaerales bacterium]|nr:tetratricopeptide repeat protein [Phycisphaerales bacterium]
MPHPPKTQKPCNPYPSRRGSARITGVVLGILALAGLGVAGYAVWSILQSPSPTPEQADPNSTGDPGTGMAQTESIEEILGAVQVYVREEDFASAQRVLEEAVVSYPTDQELRYALGDLYLLTNQTGMAYEQYLAGIEIGPESWNAHFTAGTIANTLDRPEIAEVHYAAAMRLDPNNAETPLYLAAIQQKLNRLEEAKANLAIAGRLNPTDARIYAMRAEIALRENKATIALEQVRRAREIEPNALGLILMEARALKRLRETQEAIDLLTALPMEQASTPDAVKLLAECLGAVGRFDDAASRMMDAAERQPGNAELRFEAALWLQRAGRIDEARDWAQQAADLGDARAREWLDSLP